MAGPLGRRPPTDDRHIQRYPLTATTVPRTPTPVVLGLNWYHAFDTPLLKDGNFWIGREADWGPVRGGHAICVKPPALRDSTLWWGFYDQGNEGACVGFAISRMMTLLNRKRYAADVLYLRAKQVDEWPGECVDEKTECLSQRGWLGAGALTAEDSILTFDRERNGLVWAPVERVHRYAYRPYRIWSHGNLSLAVTDNHKWVVTHRNLPGRYDLVETCDLRSQHAVPLAATSLAQPQAAEYSDDFVRLVAWAITEGHYRAAHRRGNGIAISQKVEKEQVAGVLSRLGSTVQGSAKVDGTHVWEVSGTLATMVRDVAPNKAPDVRWLMQLTPRQLRVFIETVVLADGCTTAASGNRAERHTISQKPGPILDAILAACALAGQAVGRARSGAVETWSLRTTTHTEVRKMRFSEPLYGPVWCPQTAIGTFVARRDGNIFITGNSYDGTSVRAGCDAVRTEGLHAVRGGKVGPLSSNDGIAANRWATNLAEILWCLSPGDYGATVTSAGYVTLVNSWGHGYPHQVRLPLAALQRLVFDEDGEATVVTDR